MNSAPDNDSAAPTSFTCHHFGYPFEVPLPSGFIPTPELTFDPIFITREFPFLPQGSMYFIDEASFTDPTLGDILAEALEEQRIRDFERSIVGTIFSDQNITTNTVNTEAANAEFNAGEMLDRITRMVEEADAQRHYQHCELIDTFLDADFRVVIENTDRPTITLPAHFREAYEEVMTDRLRENTANR